MANPSPVDTRRPQHPRPGKEPFSRPRTSEAAPGASARARRVLELPEPVERSAGRAVAHRTLDRLGGPVGLAVAAAPTIAFVAAEAVAGLGTALIALAVTAVLVASGVRRDFSHIVPDLVRLLAVMLVAGVLVRGAEVLLGHRSPHRRWYPDVWDLPGGHVEPGED